MYSRTHEDEGDSDTGSYLTEAHGQSALSQSELRPYRRDSLRV